MKSPISQHLKSAQWLSSRRCEVTVNELSITISPEEAKQIEAEAAPSREKVRRMLEEYQSRRGNGDSEASSSVSMAVRKKFAAYGPTSGNGG
jgi:hypothetical protein